MAKKAKPKAQAEPSKSYDDFVDDADAVEDDQEALDALNAELASKSRDWRDVERYREARELKRLVGDDLEDLFDERPRRR